MPVVNSPHVVRQLFGIGTVTEARAADIQHAVAADGVTADEAAALYTQLDRPGRRYDGQARQNLLRFLDAEAPRTPNAVDVRRGAAFGNPVVGALVETIRRKGRGASDQVAGLIALLGQTPVSMTDVAQIAEVASRLAPDDAVALHDVIVPGLSAKNALEARLLFVENMPYIATVDDFREAFVAYLETARPRLSAGQRDRLLAGLDGQRGAQDTIHYPRFHTRYDGAGQADRILAYLDATASSGTESALVRALVRIKNEKSIANDNATAFLAAAEGRRLSPRERALLDDILNAADEGKVLVHTSGEADHARLVALSAAQGARLSRSEIAAVLGTAAQSDVADLARLPDGIYRVPTGRHGLSSASRRRYAVVRKTGDNLQVRFASRGAEDGTVTGGVRDGGQVWWTVAPDGTIAGQVSANPRQPTDRTDTVEGKLRFDDDGMLRFSATFHDNSTTGSSRYPAWSVPGHAAYVGHGTVDVRFEQATPPPGWQAADAEATHSSIQGTRRYPVRFVVDDAGQRFVVAPDFSDRPIALDDDLRGHGSSTGAEARVARDHTGALVLSTLVQPATGGPRTSGISATVPVPDWFG